MRFLKLAPTFLLFVFSLNASADFKIGNSLVREEATGIEDGSYITPNELRWYSYWPVLKDKKGALISVGTFRTLHDAAAGDFDQVILFDYDRVTTRFNKLNLLAIAAAQDPNEYLDLLLNRGHSHNSPIANALERILDRQSGDATGAIQWQLEQLLDRIAKTDAWNLSIFGSAAIFSKIKKMIQDGKVHAMLGDLKGKVALRSLGDALDHEGIPVSIVDLSNAMGYITGDEELQLRQNLRGLVYSPDAWIFFTGVQYAPKHEDWEYFAWPAANFFALAANPHYWPWHYAERLKKAHDDGYFWQQTSLRLPQGLNP